MPLNLPDRLPAIELLKEENIFVIDNPGFRTDTAWHTTCHQVGACGTIQNQYILSQFSKFFFSHIKFVASLKNKYISNLPVSSAFPSESAYFSSLL